MPLLNVDPPVEDLEVLIAPEGGIYASSGENYRLMVFGRDSIEAADDFIYTYKDISLSIIDRLASLQGLQEATYTASGEQVGKIPHQHIDLRGAHDVPAITIELVNKLSQKWGGDEFGFTNYDSLDATPMFIRLISRYGLIYGPDFLNTKVQHRSGTDFTRLEYLIRSIDWLVGHLQSSSIHLLEFRREHQNSIVIQNWRDSASSFIHLDGSQANIDEYIAPVEVQGYAYDAFIMAARLFEKYNITDAAYIQLLRDYAQSLRANIFDRFWVNKELGFAMGLDRDQQHNPRQIQTPSSSQGALLDSRLFFGIEEKQRQKYVGAIVNCLYSDDFITDVGIRCRSKKYAHLTGFADYHGSWAVWIKETYDFAKGLRRQGFDDLASDLSVRILNGVTIAGENLEFLYVNPANGEVDYFPQKLADGEKVDSEHIIIGTNIPDVVQAWTVSAVIAIKRKELPVNRIKSNTWSRNLERSKLRAVGPAVLLENVKEIEHARKNAPRYRIDIKGGIAQDKIWNPDWWS